MPVSAGDERNLVLVQNANRSQASMRIPARSIMRKRQFSAVGATVIADNPSRPSKLATAQAIDVLRTAFILRGLTLSLPMAPRGRYSNYLGQTPSRHSGRRFVRQGPGLLQRPNNTTAAMSRRASVRGSCRQ